MKIIVISLLFLFIFNKAAFSDPAEKTSGSIQEETGTDNAGFFDKLFTVKVYLGYSDITFILRSNDSSNVDRDEIEYMPNVNSFYGLALSYDFLSLDLKTSRFSTDVVSDYPESEYTDVRFHLYGSSLCTDIYYLNYKKFFLKNDHDLPTGYDRSRKDLQLKYFGLNVYYIFSPDGFSFRASFLQTERQYKNGFSFLIMSNATHFIIDSDYSLIPPTEQAYFNEFAGFYEGIFDNIAIGPGIGFYLTYKNFYLTGVSSLGLTLVRYLFKTDEGDHKGLHFEQTGAGKLSAGYDGDVIFTGFTFFINRNVYKYKIMEIESMVIEIEFFGGIRF